MKTQQAQCYDAQANAALSTGEIFADVADAQRWVDELRDTSWWHLQGYSLRVLRIEVGLTRGKFAGVGWFEADKNAGRIELRSDALNACTALHEVAHVLAQAIHGSKLHDPAWARTFLTLVSCVLGSDEYLTLQRAFDAHGVDYDAPRSAQAGAITL
jgi:hypothetical protein